MLTSDAQIINCQAVILKLHTAFSALICIECVPRVREDLRAADLTDALCSCMQRSAAVQRRAANSPKTGSIMGPYRCLYCALMA